MALANAAGRPDGFADFHVCPELAKYFAGRVGIRFLVRLKDDANRETESNSAAAPPSGKAISAVQLAFQQSEKFPTRFRYAAAIFTLLPSLMLTYWYGAPMLFLILLLVWVAYMIGNKFDEKAFYAGPVYSSAVTVVRATLAHERQTSVFWSNLHWRELELEVSRLFQRMGYRAHATPGSNDKGVDVIALGPGGKTVVQCKQYAKPAQRNLVSELLGVMQSEKADHGILICTGGFAPGAESYAADNGVELWDLAELSQRSSSLSVGKVAT